MGWRRYRPVRVSARGRRLRGAAAGEGRHLPSRIDRARARPVLRSMTALASRSERCEAGAMLARIGDPRFDPRVWSLASEVEAPLGFLEVRAGSFLMGSDLARDAAAYKDEQPQHSMALPGYFIARYPVTVAQFKAFVDKSGHSLPTPRACRASPTIPSSGCRGTTRSRTAGGSPRRCAPGPARARGSPVGSRRRSGAGGR